MVIKNSTYDFLNSIIAKIGSLFFTIVLARMLMPELFGLYNLAMSTILIIGSFAVLGTNETLVKFVSQDLGKRKRNIRSIVVYLWKIRLMILGIACVTILFSARFISSGLYHKGITFALVGGIFYLVFMNFSSFLQSVFYSFNKINIAFYKEIIFQITRIILVFFGIILTSNYPNDVRLFFIFVLLGLSYLCSDLYLFLRLGREPSMRKTNFSIGKKYKLKINNFLVLTSSVLLSGVFFSYIDKIMLGHYVGAEFIGYYSAAFGIVSSIAVISGFGAAFLPIFSRMNRLDLDNILGKALKITFIMSLMMFFLTLISSRYFIPLIYGQGYAQSTSIAIILSPLIILLPLIGVFSSYFLSIEKQRILSKILVITTLINLSLNFIFIKSLMVFGDLAMVYGVCFATIISQIYYFFALYYHSKKE